MWRKGLIALALVNFANEQTTLQGVTVTTVQYIPSGVYSNPAVFNATLGAAILGVAKYL
jgi:hypothetical protein